MSIHAQTEGITYIMKLISLVIIKVFILTLVPCFSNFVPEISLEPSGMGYFGKYTGNSERYNLDGGLDISISLLSWQSTEFFIEYKNILEMGKQVGNISLDPLYSHTFIIGGFKVKKHCYLFKSYLVHDCKHVIDKPPDSNKVVFNRLKFSISQNLSCFFKRFQVEINKKERMRKLRWEFIYGFYPQSQVIDYLNSKPYYHHDFELKLEFPLFFFQKGEVFSAVNARFVISANDPPRYYRDISISFESVFFSKRGALGFYFEYFPVSQNPIKSPEGLSILGIKYYF